MGGRTRFGRLIWMVAASLMIAACASAPERGSVEEGPVRDGERGTEEEAPPEAAPDTWTENRGPQLTPEEVRRVTVPLPSAWSESPEVHALFAGAVHRYSTSPENESGLGRFVELVHDTEFSIGGEAEHSRFYTMYAGLDDATVRPEQTISAGRAIGAASADESGVRIGVYTRDDDPVWRRQTGRPPITVNGFYFWDPSFVLSPP
ncbi:MAG: hypothetical protein ACLFPO_09885 [Spirochaetaceae bacterium]